MGAIQNTWLCKYVGTFSLLSVLLLETFPWVVVLVLEC